MAAGASERNYFGEGSGFSMACGNGSGEGDGAVGAIDGLLQTVGIFVGIGWQCGGESLSGVGVFGSRLWVDHFIAGRGGDAAVGSGASEFGACAAGGLPL